MAFYDKFPYTNFQELNLDWVMQTVKKIEENWEEWAPTHEFKFADPIEWDASKYYDQYTVVLGPDGNTYLSKTAVPPGASISNTDYWQKIFDAQAAIEDINQRIDDLTQDIEKVAERYPRRTFYRPEDFGAIVNDSNFDCGPAIKQAIDAAFTNNGIVLLSEGTYYMATPVVITDHPIGLYIIGTGAWGREVNRGSGTRIWYTGTGPAFHFSNGLQNSIFEDFTIYTATGTCIRLSNDDDPSHIARTTMTTFRNMRFCYLEKGVECANAAYFRIMDSDFAALSESATKRTGIDIINTHTNNEYVYLSNLAIDNLNCTPYGGTLNNKCINIEIASHVFLHNLDLTDADYGIYLDESENEINFIYADTIDIARIRKGIYVYLNNHALNSMVIEQLIYTAPNDVGADDRVIFVEKVAGGGPHNARIKADNITLRTGANVMTYWVDSSSMTSSSAIAPSLSKFTFNNTAAPKVNYGINRQTKPEFSTIGDLEWTSAVDCNDIKESGLYYQTLTGNAANGPGFPCFILVLASVRYSTQIAFSTSSAYGMAIRIFDSYSNNWTSWRKFEGTV